MTNVILKFLVNLHEFQFQLCFFISKTSKWQLSCTCLWAVFFFFRFLSVNFPISSIGHLSKMSSDVVCPSILKQTSSKQISSLEKFIMLQRNSRCSMLSHLVLPICGYYRTSLILTSDSFLRRPGKCLLRSKPSNEVTLAPRPE